MESIGHLMVGILVLGGISQLFWAYSVSTIAQKTDQSELMQVLGWIPLLQIAPILAAGGGSVGRFLVGLVALISGNAALIGMAVFLGNDLGRAVAVLGMTLTGLLCLFYSGRIACNTATARNLPGWMGLLSFIPILNFFVYAYFAFHDGWVGPHKVGLAIGSVLIFAGIAPTFQGVRMMNEEDGFSPAKFLAMSNAVSSELDEAARLSPKIILESEDRISISDDPANVQPELAQREQEAIRALYQLKGRFDTLDSLATPENLLIHDLRVRALGIIQTIRTDLEARQSVLDASTYEELAAHLLEIEARVQSDPSAIFPIRRSVGTTGAAGESHSVPAAPDPAGLTTSNSYSDTNVPPVRPYSIQASDDCPPGTETRSRKDERGEEEWCQQLSAYGGLRHGWYARYLKDGRPESMGQYQNGLRVGVWTRFYPTGEVRAQAQFREGMQDGWVLTFDQTGKRTRSVRYEHGAPVHPK